MNAAVNEYVASGAIEQAAWDEYEHKGYESWVEIRNQHNSEPDVNLCPARQMPAGPKRFAFIRGWNKARIEHSVKTTYKDFD